MARVLIVGCGCRGSELALKLIDAGYAVRGTTRTSDGLARIEATGAEAVIVDPDRLSTVMPQLDAVAVVCWLMGTASGDDEGVAALHGDRLAAVLERVVDTGVRGFVYEANGTVDPALFESGSTAIAVASETWRIRCKTVRADPAENEAWLIAMKAAVDGLLGL